MEKRFNAKTEDNIIADTPDRRAGLILLFVSCILIVGIAVAVVVAMKIHKDNVPVESESSQTVRTSAASPTTPEKTTFRVSYPAGSVPTDCMTLRWGMQTIDIKLKYPDVIKEKQSPSSDERNTVNISYKCDGKVGGYEFSNVMLSADKGEGLYAFSYLLPKDQYQSILTDLTDDYGKPDFKSGDSAYWQIGENLLLYLTVRTVDAGEPEYTFLQYINTKEAKAPENAEKTPVIKLGMTIDEIRKRKLSVTKTEVYADGTEIYISDKGYDVTSDANLGAFAPLKANASAAVFYVDPKADLTTYSFIFKGDFLYEIREKIANTYGNPSINRDFSSQWNLYDGKGVITVTYGRMTGSGRGFATELRYSCSAQEYKALELIKAVGRATKKGLKYTEVREELGKYYPSENIDKKGNGTMTYINNDQIDIVVFGVRIRSVEIEFKKNVVTDVYYLFDGKAYDTLKRNIEVNYGGGENKNRFKDRIRRVQWHPKTTENNKFTKLMLDYVNLKVNPKARVHYYG